MADGGHAILAMLAFALVFNITELLKNYGQSWRWHEYGLYMLQCEVDSPGFR